VQQMNNDSRLLVKWCLRQHPHTGRHNESLQTYYTGGTWKDTASPFAKLHNYIYRQQHWQR